MTAPSPISPPGVCPFHRASPRPSLPPGSRAPKIVQLLRYLRDPVQEAERSRERFGPLFTVRVTGFPDSVHINTASGTKTVFSSPAHVVRAGEGNKPIEFILGKRAVFRLDGEDHRRARKQLMPSLHGDRIQAYGAAMASAVDGVLAEFSPGQIIPISRVMEKLTMGILLDTIFRIPAGPRHDALQEAVIAFLEEAMAPLPALLSFVVTGEDLRQLLIRYVAPTASYLRHVPIVRRLSVLRLARVTKVLDDCLFDEIRRRRGTHRMGADILSELVHAERDDGVRFTDEELRDTLLALLVAGYETTSRTLAWAIDLAVRRPDVANKLHAESLQVVGSEFDPERIKDLVYTEAVLRETLRLYPPVPSLPRLLGEPLDVDGITIPKGVCAEPVIVNIHRDPSYWPNPMTFEPERFLDGKTVAGTYLPFGGGLRTCPGMTFALFEMKLVVSRLFGKARFAPVAAPLPKLGASGILLGPMTPNRVVYLGPVATDEERN